MLFRATEQWFCSVDDIKRANSQSHQDVTWIPGWGSKIALPLLQDKKRPGVFPVSGADGVCQFLFSIVKGAVNL